MKRDCLILIVFVVGCALLLQIGCQQAPDVPKEPKTVAEPEPVTIPAPPPAEARPTEPQRPKRAPKITFEKEICDLGEIAPGTKNVCEFKFSNTGDALLKVTRAQACCGFLFTYLFLFGFFRRFLLGVVLFLRLCCGCGVWLSCW